MIIKQLEATYVPEQHVVRSQSAGVAPETVQTRCSRKLLRFSRREVLHHTFHLDEKLITAPRMTIEILNKIQINQAMFDFKKGKDVLMSNSSLEQRPLPNKSFIRIFCM